MSLRSAGLLVLFAGLLPDDLVLCRPLCRPKGKRRRAPGTTSS